MQFLATTNRGLESVASREIKRLTGTSAETHHPGMVSFEADLGVVSVLHERAYTLHRLLLVRKRTEIESLESIYAATRALAVEEIFAPDSPFAVRAQRHGDHEFSSPDIERVIGQAIIDEYRECANARPPVDLDDPDVIFRVLVRHDSLLLAVDATGQRSLHRRWYRRNEHEAALRPTVAASLLQIAGYTGDRPLLDPMCGCGTIPVEAALRATGRSPTRDHQPAYPAFRFLDQGETTADASTEQQAVAQIRGCDIASEWIEAARENAALAGVQSNTVFETRDVTTASLDVSLIVSDLPFGIRTDETNIAGLYRSFFDRTADADWERMVLLTTRDDLVPYEPVERYDIRRGQIEAAVLVIE